MKLYYYIHTGHRYGLDRLRRGAVLYKKLKQEGIEAEVLLNDYRATIVAKELGIEASTAIDSMFNIASLAQAGDGLILDTPELTDELLQQMCHYFKVVVNFSEKKPKFSEKVISRSFEDENSVKMLLIDDNYFKEEEKNGKTVLFYGDADYERNLLKQKDLFKGMDLILGHYFFLEYENELKDGFEKILQEYEMITSYTNVVTRSLQTALEAGASGANICYIADELLSLVTLQEELGIKTVNTTNQPIEGALAEPLNIDALKKLSEKLNYKSIFEKLDLCQFKFN